MEASFIFKEFFDRTIDTNKYESRSSKHFIDCSVRENYIFNSTINGIEESDLIMLIGTNPRFEATMLNARIRKAYLNNNTKIISLNDVGDLTYPYQSLDGKTETIKNLTEDKNEISNYIKDSRKPLIILGESFLKVKAANYLFQSLKKFLSENGKFINYWNPLNILSTNASTVGSFDLGLVDETNKVLDDLMKNEFEIVYLVGQDNLDFIKKDEFIIYQGSHGDKGAEIADIILPGGAYTEQSAHYTNLEGKIQKAFKASYPPGDAKEDWQIINEIAETMNNRKLFNDKEELESSMFNYLNLKKDKQKEILINNSDQKEFENEDLKVEFREYYFSNVIAKASKTMLDCNNSKIEIKKTGTEG